MTRTQAQVNAMRDELFRREAAGEQVTEAEWDAVGDAQRAINDATHTREGYMKGFLL